MKKGFIGKNMINSDFQIRIGKWLIVCRYKKHLNGFTWIFKGHKKAIAIYPNEEKPEYSILVSFLSKVNEIVKN